MPLRKRVAAVFCAGTVIVAAMIGLLPSATTSAAGNVRYSPGYIQFDNSPAGIPFQVMLYNPTSEAITGRVIVVPGNFGGTVTPDGPGTFSLPPGGRTHKQFSCFGEIYCDGYPLVTASSGGIVPSMVYNDANNFDFYVYAGDWKRS